MYGNDFREIVDSVLNNKAQHFIKNKHIRVLRSKQRPLKGNIQEKVDISAEKVAHLDVQRFLEEISDPEEQMACLVEILELTNEDLEDRKQITRHIQVIILSRKDSLRPPHVCNGMTVKKHSYCKNKFYVNMANLSLSIYRQRLFHISIEFS